MSPAALWRGLILALLGLIAPVSTALVAFGQEPKPDQSGQVDDYNQWKLSLGPGQATDPRQIQTPRGFRVELLRSARPDEGSWIALAFDPRGRLLVSREDQGILRMTLPARPGGELRVETINETLRECRGLLWAHDALYANANNSKALYRLRDADGDDRFEDVQLLKATTGNVGHGRNDLALGPDGMIYSIHGDDVAIADADRAPASPYRNFADHRLLPCAWDSQLFNSIMQFPGGHLARTDRDGKSWEIVAAGLRNPYGIDFNTDGECFTYDADMEWDVGMPWYRPTRVLHLASGADFGWRYGTGAWPDWYPDGWPTTLPIGLGSPTAVKFGTHSRFPEPYRGALFILDWSYGRILAVHLRPHGASYRAQEQTFILGRPLNVTDLEFGPDGALYFLTGGRRTQSGLYRVTYMGDVVVDGKGEEARVASPATTPVAPPLPDPPALAPCDPATVAQASQARALRRRLEALHGHESPDTISSAWPHLDHEDDWIRHAARVAIERQPPGSWLDRALAESRPRASAAALLAAARFAPVDRLPAVVDRIMEVGDQATARSEMVVLLRALRLALARGPRPAEERAARLRGWCESRFPSEQPHWDLQLCELLVFLESPEVVKRTLPRISLAKTQEEKIGYLYHLRHARTPWTLEQRQTYFEWLREAHGFYGAHFLPKFLQFMRDDAIATLSDAEKAALGDLLGPPRGAPESTASLVINRPLVREWKLDDLIGSLDFDATRRDFKRGESVFAEALCAKCHRLGGQGSPVGPDLTQVGRRFGRRDLLVSLLYPSHAVDEKYRGSAITTDEGRVYSGRVAGDDGTTLTLIPDLLNPDKVIRIPRSSIESLTPTLQSPMPAGLLNTFSKSEILDLLALLERGEERAAQGATQGASPP